LQETAASVFYYPFFVGKPIIFTHYIIKIMFTLTQRISKKLVSSVNIVEVLIFVIVLLIGNQYCQLNALAQVRDELSVTPAPNPVTADTVTQTILIQSNASWTVSTDKPWIHILTSQGTGNGTVKIFIQANPDGVTRLGTYTVKTTNGAQLPIAIIQNAGPGRGLGIFPAVTSVSISEKPSFADFSVFPNPASEVITIHGIVQHSGQWNVKIMNVLGQEMNTFQYTTFPGEATISIPILNLTLGTYMIEISDGNRQTSFRFIKK